MTPINSAFARLSMLEFVLEVAYARSMLSMTEAEADAFKSNLLRAGAHSYGPMSANPDGIAEIQEISAATTAMLERFVDKVSRREKEMRAQISRVPPNR